MSAPPIWQMVMQPFYPGQAAGSMGRPVGRLTANEPRAPEQPDDRHLAIEGDSKPTHQHIRDLHTSMDSRFDEQACKLDLLIRELEHAFETTRSSTPVEKFPNLTNSPERGKVSSSTAKDSGWTAKDSCWTDSGLPASPALNSNFTLDTNAAVASWSSRDASFVGRRAGFVEGLAPSGSVEGEPKSTDPIGGCENLGLSFHLRSLGYSDVGSKSAWKPKGRSEGYTPAHGDEEWVDGEHPVCTCFRRFQRFIHSTLFDYIMGVVIIVNTVFLGIQINIEVTYLKENPDQEYIDAIWLQTSETVFNIIFLGELISRLASDNRYFLHSGWNIFDFVIVFLALFDEVKKYNIFETPGLNASATRVVKVFRLLRTLKIIRVIRAFRELRIVLMSMMSSMRQLFWTLLLLFLMMYIVSVLLLSILAQEGPRAYAMSGEGPVRVRLFGDLQRTLVTMFQCATNGLNWEEPSRALEEVIDGPIPPIGVMIAFNAITFFALLNTVTGLFVDQALRSSDEDNRNVMLEEREEREGMIVDLRSKFTNAVEGKHFINLKAMHQVCSDYKTMEYFRRFEIDFRDFFTFFDLVAEPDRTIQMAQLDSFLHAAFRLKGKASQTELVALAYNSGKLK
jgi:hypothetical protein